LTTAVKSRDECVLCQRQGATTTGCILLAATTHRRPHDEDHLLSPCTGCLAHLAKTSGYGEDTGIRRNPVLPGRRRLGLTGPGVLERATALRINSRSQGMGACLPTNNLAVVLLVTRALTVYELRQRLIHWDGYRLPGLLPVCVLLTDPPAVNPRLMQSVIIVAADALWYHSTAGFRRVSCSISE
jgi:hypothetical protein